MTPAVSTSKRQRIEGQDAPGKGREKWGIMAPYSAIAVADAVQRLDGVEIVGHDFELLAQPLDVAVDGAVIDIDLIVVSAHPSGCRGF